MVPTRITELPGEDLETLTVSEVASWITIYEELASVLRSVQTRRDGSTDAADLAVDLAWVEGRLRRWRERHARLAGLRVDTDSRTVTFAGRGVALTRRETDLLAYLLAHPYRPFNPQHLALAAWNNPRLSDAQVRTYMMRLRRRLAELGAGDIIKVVKRRGYELRQPQSPVPSAEADGAA